MRSKKSIKKSTKTIIGQCIACVAACVLPVSSFVIMHFETGQNPWLYFLVVAALGYSAPTLAKWAEGWTHNLWKAWSFTILLEGTMVFSHIQALAMTGLSILVLINGFWAWNNAARIRTTIPTVKKVKKA